MSRRPWILRPTLILAAGLVAACGDDASSGDPDAGTGAADASAVDGGGETSDGGGGTDAGGETSDAGAEDAGLAGSDASADPDAGMPPEPCGEPGETRAVPCGSCGLASQRCGEDGLWEEPGACLGEGECAPGSVETEATPYCGERARICDEACSWRAWTETVPGTGACDPGETRMVEADCGPDGQREQTCSDACDWESSGPCVDLCGGTARMTPADATEICIPAGAFVRGGPRVYATPVGEVRVSAYYIDKYPVTNERYADCVSAGACEVPLIGAALHEDPSRARYPVQGVSRAQAETFCAWDGRRLPTEAEWEKAARGPAPREQPFLWDGPDYDCALLYSGLCGYEQEDGVIPDEIDDLPGTRSYYGTEMMVGGGVEFTSDHWLDTYYSDPSSYDDPAGPASGTSFVLRGMTRRYEPIFGDPDETRFAVYYRRGVGGTGGVPAGVIRCARTP